MSSELTATASATETLASLRGDLDDLRGRELRLRDAVADRSVAEVIALKARIAALEARAGDAARTPSPSTADAASSQAVIGSGELGNSAPSVDVCEWLSGCVSYPLDGPLVPLRAVDVETLGLQAASGIPVRISAALPVLRCMRWLRLVGCGLTDDHVPGLGEKHCSAIATLLCLL